MTNGQAADRDSWLVRCSPCAPGFSQSNQGLEEEYWEGGGIKDFFKGGGGSKKGGDTLCKLCMNLFKTRL